MKYRELTWQNIHGLTQEIKRKKKIKERCGKNPNQLTIICQWNLEIRN